MHISRRFTTAGESPYASIPFKTTTSEIKDVDGKSRFKMEGIEVPAHWSQVAADVLAPSISARPACPTSPSG